MEGLLTKASPCKGRPAKPLGANATEISGGDKGEVLLVLDLSGFVVWT